MKYLFLIFLCSCASINQKELTIDLTYKENKNKNKFECLFLPQRIMVEIKNNTKNSIFIPGIKTKEIKFYDYIPLLENYESYKRKVKAKIDNLKDYLEKGKNGYSIDEFYISFPIFYDRFQVNSKGDTIDLFYKISELQEIYNTQTAYCSNNPYKVPAPPKMLSDGLGDTIWLNRGEKKILYYDITPFLMRKGTYKFRFKINDNICDDSINEKKVRGYSLYKKPIISQELIIHSR